MIVTDKNVQDALIYLSDDPHPIAKAKRDLTKAETSAKQQFALAFLHESGSVDARKAAAEVSPQYIEAQDTLAGAVMEFERHKSRVKAAEMIIEIWRSENANARAAERVR